jgi:outer membrane protein OmpA-like peptidoglycan-associated protein
LPGQVTHFYLASRVAQSYSTSSDPTLNAIHIGFKQVLAANLALKKAFEDAISKKNKDMAIKAIQKYRSTLVTSDDIAIFSAFCAGAVGPDLWTIPNSTSDALLGKITGSWYFDLGHYNLSHLFPHFTLDKIRTAPATLSNMQKHYQKAYIFGYISHISLDILAHLKVNVFAGAYHNQIPKVWETEQGFIKEKVNIFNNHNKVEHYLDSYVRFFCFEGYHPDNLKYIDARKNDFGQNECWHFPNYTSYWKNKLGDAGISISGDDQYIIDLSTSLAGAFAHRYKKSEGSELVTPFIRQYFWDAYKNCDGWLRSTDAGTLHPDNFKDKDRPEEWVKLKYFSIVDDIWWNDLNDEVDTQYYYLNTVIPDLEKVNKNTRKFYSPEAFGHFIQGSISVARSFIDDAAAYLATGNKSHLNRLRFWNLDTGHSLRIRKNIVDSTTKNTIPACIDIISVLEDSSLSSWSVPQIKEWNTLSADRQDEWNGIPKLPASTPDDKLSIKVKSGDTKTLVVNRPVDIAIRIRNTCFFEGDKESEIAAWIFGNDTAYDENAFISGDKEQKADPLYKIDKSSCLDDFSSKYASVEKRKVVKRESRLYTSSFRGANTKGKKSTGADKIDVDLPKRLLPRFIKVSSARKWVFYPTGSGNFEPDTTLHTYKTLYPSEDIALAVFALIKSADQYIDCMHDKTFNEADLVKLKKVKVVGINVAVMIFALKTAGNYELTNAWIDGEEVSFEEAPVPPVPGDDGTDTTPPEDDPDKPIKALLKGMHFDTSKSFLLPSAIPALKRLNDIYDSYTKVRMLIVGHTDTAGRPGYNQILSLERANALKAYLTDNWSAWYKYYTHETSDEKRWGDHEDRLMIKSMSDFTSKPATEDEIRWYQRTRSLVTDGFAGPKTREQLIKEYMNIDGTTLPSTAEVVVHGCGESHPAKKTGDGVAEIENRRVEVFFFPEAISPEPKTPCPERGCAEYEKWIGTTKKEVVIDPASSSSGTSSSLFPTFPYPTAPSGSSASSIPSFPIYIPGMSTPTPAPASTPVSSGTGSFTKPARAVHTVFLHCSASDNPAHDSAAVIDSWHKANGWSGIGYHYFIRKDGTIEKGRDLEKTPAAQSEHNPGTIAICAHGLEISKFTDVQLSAVKALCTEINNAYGRTLKFRGHREVASKSCPVFDYKTLLDLDATGQMRGAV